MPASLELEWEGSRVGTSLPFRGSVRKQHDIWQDDSLRSGACGPALCTDRAGARFFEPPPCQSECFSHAEKVHFACLERADGANPSPSADSRRDKTALRIVPLQPPGLHWSRKEHHFRRPALTDLGSNPYPTRLELNSTLNDPPNMAVPKRKHSNSRTGKRRSHDRVKKRQIAYCPQCSIAVPTHTICPKCGYYQGRTVIEPKEA